MQIEHSKNFFHFRVISSANYISSTVSAQSIKLAVISEKILFQKEFGAHIQLSCLCAPYLSLSGLRNYYNDSYFLLFHFISQFSSSRVTEKSSSLTEQIFMKGLRENDMREKIKKFFHENGKFSFSLLLCTPLGAVKKFSNNFLTILIKLSLFNFINVGHMVKNLSKPTFQFQFFFVTLRC